MSMVDHTHSQDGANGIGYGHRRRKTEKDEDKWRSLLLNCY